MQQLTAEELTTSRVMEPQWKLVQWPVFGSGPHDHVDTLMTAGGEMIRLAKAETVFLAAADAANKGAAHWCVRTFYESQSLQERINLCPDFIACTPMDASFPSPKVH